jgi:hypothetical protein
MLHLVAMKLATPGHVRASHHPAVTIHALDGITTPSAST